MILFASQQQPAFQTVSSLGERGCRTSVLKPDGHFMEFHHNGQLIRVFAGPSGGTVSANLTCDDGSALSNTIAAELVRAIGVKDSYTCAHSDRGAQFAYLTAQTLHLDDIECERIHLAGLLHDIGKVGISDEILRKTSAVTESEMQKIRQHPVIGSEILLQLPGFECIVPGVLHHHESFDGTGYPDGLSGTSIPLSSRILAVADSWDAMTSDRSYRRAMSADRAACILQEGAGQQWDPQCVDAFLKCVNAVDVRDGHCQFQGFVSRTVWSTPVGSVSA